MSIALWDRSQHEPTHDVARVFLLAFARDPIDVKVPLSMSRHGLPSREALETVQTMAVARKNDPEWFDNWRTGALRTIAANALGDELAKLDAAEHVNTIRVELEDPQDLGYLQASWAAAKWFVDGGADVVVDVFAGRFYTADQIVALDPGRDFSIHAETLVVFETDVRAPYAGHLMHTRGMLKFARPDVLMVVDGTNNDEDLAVLNGIARGLADGRVLKPGQTIRIGDRTLRATQYSPSPDEDVHLNNAGLFLEPGPAR